MPATEPHPRYDPEHAKERSRSRHPTASGWERVAGRGQHVPVLAGRAALGRRLGGRALLAGQGEAGSFTEEHRGLAESLAPHAALAIQNAQLYARERAAREESERLQAATRALSATLDPQQVFALILSELRALVPYDSASVMELKGQRLEIVARSRVVRQLRRTCWA